MLTTSEPNALPKYLALCQKMEEQIASGELKPGDRLPSFVQMKEQYGVTTATVDRILQMLEKKGLVRREASRGVFVTARTPHETKGVIGVLTQAAYREHSYYMKLLKGAQDKAHELGVELLLIMENSVVSRDKVDGVIAMVTMEHPARQIPVEMPIVSLMGSLPGLSGVVVDDYSGTVKAMEHLFELGHRRIAFLTLGNLPLGVWGVPNGDIASVQRLMAYFEAFRRRGIQPDPRWCRRLREEHELNQAFENFAEKGREKMQRWVEEDWKELGCTALLTQNDDVAFQAIQILQKAGYRVPEQVSVVGFDNTSMSTLMHPHITTIDAGLERAGARAITMLLDKIAQSSIESGERETETVVLPSKLVVRESTGAASRQAE